MAYVFAAEQLVSADPGALWSVWTDPDRFPEWDPREERTTLHGPFAVGSTIDSKQRGNPGGSATITAVEPRSSWTLETPLTGGRLVIDHEIELGSAGFTVRKRYAAYGPLSVLFRLYYGPRVRAALPASFAALAAEAHRRDDGGR